MESSSTTSAKLLLDFNAKDQNGHDVFQRATLENNAHLVQFLLSCSSTVTSTETDACGWNSGQNLWLVRRGTNAQGTYCTCFVPAPVRELKVRYPLIFAKTFPRVKALLRDPNAGQVLEQYRTIMAQEAAQNDRGLVPVPTR